MTILLLAALALAVIAGFWYSYYQSLKKLKAHDRETVRLMELDLERLQTSGASPDAVEAFRLRIQEFRTKHKVH
jgi:hypothetical protein